MAAEPEPLRLDAYYYIFDETGCRPVDEVLAAVADAGRRSHHTEGWTASDNWDDGPTPVEVIQQAAARAAAALAAAESRAADAEAGKEAAERRVGELEVELEVHRSRFDPCLHCGMDADLVQRGGCGWAGDPPAMCCRALRRESRT